MSGPWAISWPTLAAKPPLKSQPSNEGNSKSIGKTRSHPHHSLLSLNIIHSVQSIVFVWHLERCEVQRASERAKSSGMYSP